MGYSKEVYRKAFAALDRRREKAQENAAQRKAELQDKIPELRQIERDMADTGLSAAKAAISGAEDTPQIIERLKQKNIELQKRRAALLAQAGLPEDILQVQFTCPHCGDTGYIGQKQCTCMRELLCRIAYSAVSDNSGIETCRFENFSLAYYPDETDGTMSDRRVMEKVFDACREYADKFCPQSESLLFFGNTGLGKTHLSLAIAYEVIQRGYGVYYTSCQRLIDKLQAQQFQHSTVADSTDYQALALQCDLLIIDDLGAEFVTAFTVSAIQNLVNSRLVEHRPTIVNTNFDVRLLSERYGERLVSRLFCAYHAYPFRGTDIRKQKRYQ